MNKYYSFAGKLVFCPQKRVNLSIMENKKNMGQ
jgi:hypothetical protein